MSVKIEVDRQKLVYDDGEHKLVLHVDWSFTPKTPESPVDFEVDVSDVKTWTEPAGQPIDRATWEKVLDEIAARYAKGPQADIVGHDGALLRGVSQYKFYLQSYPRPSRYYEVGRYLAIPMVQTDKSARQSYVLDISGTTAWTSPKEPLPRQRLDEIVARIVKKNPHVGVLG